MNEFTAATYALHTNVLWLCALIAVLVFAVMIYSIATFRKVSANSPASIRHGALAEILWAIIPILIVISMSVPAVRTLVVAAEKPTIHHAAAENSKHVFQPVRRQL